MIKNSLFTFMIISCFLITSSANAVNLDTAEITLKVTDEQGKPVKNALASITFEVFGKGGMGTGGYTIEGLTNSEGIYSAKHSVLFSVFYSVSKEDYYKSRGDYTFRESKSGRKIPWNPTVEVLLRKIEKPVPMYNRDTKMDKPRLNLPASGREIGFDLVKYDWLPPYGSGVQADFIFKLEKRYANVQDYEGKLTISFSNEFDGIQLYKENTKDGSSFKLPRYAPADGYSNKLVLKKVQIPGKPVINDFQEDNNYFFRVRSEVKDGKLVRAMYGKIKGPVEFRRLMQEGAKLNFTYYLNPDYTRNMEFGSNLFPNE